MSGKKKVGEFGGVLRALAKKWRAISEDDWPDNSLLRRPAGYQIEKCIRNTYRSCAEELEAVMRRIERILKKDEVDRAVAQFDLQTKFTSAADVHLLIPKEYRVWCRPKALVGGLTVTIVPTKATCANCLTAWRTMTSGRHSRVTVKTILTRDTE